MMTTRTRPSFLGAALRRTLLLTALASIGFAAPASAGDRENPTHIKDLAPYEFVVKEKNDEYTMRIKDDEYGVLGGLDSGYIKYRVAMVGDEEIVQINMVRGIKELPGVGKALKAEVLERYPERRLTSKLEEENKKRLFKMWAKGYPHRSNERNGAKLRKVVPAMQFEGFVYIVTAKPAASGTGGEIWLEMRPARPRRKGKIIIENPVELDKILVTSYAEYIRAKDRPKSERELEKEARENEKAAKEAREKIEDLAEHVSKDEGVDEDDLLEHLLDVMKDMCGDGGRDGKRWAEDCLFTEKGRSFVVTPGHEGRGFYLERRMEEEAEDFVKDNR